MCVVVVMVRYSNKIFLYQGTPAYNTIVLGTVVSPCTGPATGPRRRFHAHVTWDQPPWYFSFIIAFANSSCCCFARTLLIKGCLWVVHPRRCLVRAAVLLPPCELLALHTS